MKALITTIAILMIALSGCENEIQVDDSSNKIGAVKNYIQPDERCINGVLYYQYYSAMSVAYNRDSTVKTCQ